MGTPETLEEMIIVAITIGPLNQLDYRLRIGIRDFLAQKFGVALLICAPDQEYMLKDLWFAITGEIDFGSKK